MKHVLKSTFLLMLMLSLAVSYTSCSKKGGGGSKQTSSATGWNYNDPKWGGFEVAEKKEQKNGPGLILVPGGTFVMGNTGQDLMFEYHSIPRRVTVSSFYMDETEVANVHYREYIFWLNKTFGASFPEMVEKAKPDTLCWLDELTYNEPYVEYYFQHPAYNDYPVVGVTWLQAREYCKWRSDRVNESELIKEGIIDFSPEQSGADHFNTEAYLLGQYEPIEKKGMKNLSPNAESETRRVRFDDGILLPDYRLPTEAEWEYAALAQIAEGKDEERYTDRKMYPWVGSGVRYGKHGKWHGDMMANFKRGEGDYMGIAGALNDNAEITAPVISYVPNDFGLYNMAGNVSEWCLDVYRPMTSQDAGDFNPFRGNIFTVKEKDEEGKVAPKDSLGRIKYRELTDDELGKRDNIRKANAINYRDGDNESTALYDTASTLITDKSRVYKGGSWKDPAYFMTPGTRRYMDEDKSGAHLGFRCAMIRVGSPDGKKIKAPKVKKAKL